MVRIEGIGHKKERGAVGKTTRKVGKQNLGYLVGKNTKTVRADKAPVLIHNFLSGWVKGYSSSAVPDLGILR